MTSAEASHERAPTRRAPPGADCTTDEQSAQRERRVMLGAAESMAGVLRAAVCRELGDEAFEALGRDLRARGAMRGEAAYVYEEIRTVAVRRILAIRKAAWERTARPARGLRSVLRGTARDRGPRGTARSSIRKAAWEWTARPERTNQPARARTLKMQGRAGAFRCKSIAFEVPDPANQALLSAED